MTPRPPDPIRPGDRVNRREDRPQVGATVAAVIETEDSDDPTGAGLVLLLHYDEGGSGWWPASSVEPAADPQP
jgi:hypothetical protein